MCHSVTPLLITALLGVPLTSAVAQEVTKPGITGSRLPAPTSVTARQLADGRIQVTWKSIPDAERYQVTR